MGYATRIVYSNRMTGGPAMSLSKVDEFLNAAKVCLDSEFCNSSINRSYYAMYRSAIAAIEHQGYMPVKRWNHEGVIRMFNRELVHLCKIYPKESVADLRGAYYLRLDADYSTLEIDKEKAQVWFDKAREFVQRIREEMRKDAQQESR